MREILEHLINESGERACVGGQLIFTSGMAMNGAVRKAPMGDGVFELFTLGQNNQTKTAVEVHTYFKAESLLCFNKIDDLLIQPAGANGAIKVVGQ